MKNSFNSETSGRNRRIDRPVRWFARRRRAIATHVLRGACYGIGTGAAGFGFWWIEWRLQHNL